MHLTVSGRDVTEGRPRLKAYVERVKSRLNPVFDEVHQKLYDWRDTSQKKSTGKVGHDLQNWDRVPVFHHWTTWKNDLLELSRSCTKQK